MSAFVSAVIVVAKLKHKLTAVGVYRNIRRYVHFAKSTFGYFLFPFNRRRVIITYCTMQNHIHNIHRLKLI